ncbi:MAG: hypothetical protein RRZ84_05325 [Romboutsia sp.]
MAKHPNRIPKYNKRPDAMKIEAARELGITEKTGIEVNVALAAQGEPKYSKKTMNKINNLKTEYRFENREGN